MSRESAPMSSVNEVERVTCSLLTPRFSHTMLMTRSSTEGTIVSSPANAVPVPIGGSKPPTHCLASGYVPQRTYTGQGNLPLRSPTMTKPPVQLVKRQKYNGY